MSRKGENIYKRKDGRWEGRFIKDRSPDGKAIYGYLYARSYRELKEKLARADRFENKTVTDKSECCGYKFSDAAGNWLSSIRPYVKESTDIKYYNLLNNYILPRLGSIAVQSLSYEILSEFCNNLLLRGGIRGNGLSPKTVADSIAVVRTILQYSANRGIVSPCNARAITIKQRQRKMRVLSRYEQERLCQYLYAHLNERNLGILICLFTGLRIGEICALKWEDISVRERTIHVHQTMQRIQSKSTGKQKTVILFSAPKSACSIRTIPLPDKLAKTLSSYRQAPSAYVLTGSTNKYVEPRTMLNHFQKTLRDCSIEKANYHALRHTFATRCVELGFDVKSLSEILGHANVNITMNRYVHPSLELKRDNMNRLSELIAVR